MSLVYGAVDPTTGIDWAATLGGVSTAVLGTIALAFTAGLVLFGAKYGIKNALQMFRRVAR